MQPGEIGSSRTRGFAAIRGMRVIANLHNPAGSPVQKTAAVGPGCSLIGILKSSILETDALAGVTVLFGVSSRPPHHGCQG